MSDTVSAYDFTAARRGYAPEQVARAVSALVAHRDEAWQKLSVLGSRVRELEAELTAALQAAADAPPPEYDGLSERAGRILAMAEEESATVWEAAQREAQQARCDAYEAGNRWTQEADEAADAIRAQADHHAEQRLAHARAEAVRLHDEAAHDTGVFLGAAEQDATGASKSAQELTERAEAELAARQCAADEEQAAAESRVQEVEDRITALGERRLQDAARHREIVLARVKEIEEEAQTRVARVLQRAQREAERIAETVEREQESYAERQDRVQVQLDHIRQTLAAVTGGLQAGTAVAVAGAAARTVPAPAAESSPGGDSDCGGAEVPLPFPQPPVAYRECPVDDDRYFG